MIIDQLPSPSSSFSFSLFTFYTLSLRLPPSSTHSSLLSSPLSLLHPPLSRFFLFPSTSSPSPSHPHIVLEGFEIPHPDFQFKSNKKTDQRLLSQNMPPALLKQYNQATPPPNLSKFDSNWEDQRHAMHIYSKPDFFFQSWRDKIQRQTLKKMSQMDLLSVSRYMQFGVGT